MTTTMTRETEQATDSYRREPLLTKEQERFYIARVQQYRDTDAQEHLVRSNIGWVIKIAERWIRQGIEFEDLIQEGCIGLLKAVDHFNLSSSFRLTTYASWWIRQAMDRHTMNTNMTIRLPVYLHPIMQALKQDEMSGNDTVTDTYDPEQVAVVRQTMRAVHSLDALLVPAKYDDLTLIDLLADDDTPTEERALRSVFQHEVVVVLGQVLTEREMRVLSLRYGLHNQAEHTLEQVGALEHVTRERVRQIEQAAFAKLRRSPLIKELAYGRDDDGETS